MRTAISQKKEEIFTKKSNIKLINLTEQLVKYGPPSEIIFKMQEEVRYFNNESMNIRNSLIKELKLNHKKFLYIFICSNHFLPSVAKKLSESEWDNIIQDLNEKKNEFLAEMDSLSQEIEELQVKKF